ncbi:MAG: DUF4202 family protein [Candidatus Saccharibacteria bacterium]
MSTILQLTEKYVNDSFSEDGKLSNRGKHCFKTEEWLLIIYPEADESMLIAAVAHDIDSAFVEYKSTGSFKDPEYLAMHQEGAADVVGKFLENNDADKGLIDSVKHMVEKHEVGGDERQNLIKDADSLGFFDRNLEEFIIRHSKRGSSKAILREKFDWMYDRITSLKAKEIATPMYNESIRLLEKING